MKTTFLRILAATALAAIALAAAACRDHGVIGPGSGGGSLDTMWPYHDGLGWTYQVAQRSLVGSDVVVYGSADSVPPAPDMREIESRLGHPYTGPVNTTDSSTFTLRFVGSITTGSGVTAKNLTETWILPGGIRARSGDALLTRLFAARPDLRPRLRARLASLGSLEDTVASHPGLLLHGYAWEKTPEWIGTYGDVDRLLAWKFLTSNLVVGSEFVHQLVPSLADDVFLHARILPARTVVTPAGTFRNVTVCAYLVDYGVSAMIDTQGMPTGYSRMYDFGTVTYVAGVGPVASYEQRMLWAGGGDTGNDDVSLALTSTGRSKLDPFALAR